MDGRSILHLRHWDQTPDRRWLPTKAGVTIRLSEIDQTIRALEAAKLAMIQAAAETIKPKHGKRCSEDDARA